MVGKPTDVAGEFGATVEFKGNQTQSTIYVTRTGGNLLGWMDQKKLEIVLDPNSDEQVMIRSDVINAISEESCVWEKEFPEGRELINKLVHPWMCERELLSEERKHVVKKRKQAQSKYVNTGKKRERNVEVGDWVRIRLPGIIAKGSSKFSVPKKVVDVKRCVVKLEDGKWWNRERLAVQRNGGEDTTKLDNEVEEGKECVDEERRQVYKWMVVCRRSERETRKPLWLQNCVE
ncbi:hypothetical protein NDU88_006410 [Pleurodeles waltl]|uniref:Uncharacterized protein n=1 Tax=Pleurodeles waltl TaxID=8319 RepID=A0AAV7UM16_PLEWA|nr:hypothetical protein NDU88_006410 [Pleurodeles waltl]